MAALSTRAEIVNGQDDYLVPLPMTGDTATSFPKWLDAIVDGDQCATLVWDYRQLVAAGYEFSRDQSVTTKPERLPFAHAILHYRQGWCVERDFHPVKDAPLDLSPLFVWRDDQIS
jgi:transposase